MLEALYDPLPDEKVDREDMMVRLSRRVGFSVSEYHDWGETSSVMETD